MVYIHYFLANTFSPTVYPVEFLDTHLEATAYNTTDQIGTEVMRVCYASSCEVSIQFSSVQFISVAQSCQTLCDPMDCSMPGLPVHHQLLELAQTPVHWVGDAIQLSHPLLSPSPAFNHSQHQGLFQWVSSSHQVANGLEFQLQHQSFQWIFRIDCL